jgi:hypothetical protein
MKLKIRFRFDMSFRGNIYKAGQIVWVEKEQADYLIEIGRADRVSFSREGK